MHVYIYIFTYSNICGCALWSLSAWRLTKKWPMVLFLFQCYFQLELPIAVYDLIYQVLYSCFLLLDHGNPRQRARPSQGYIMKWSSPVKPSLQPLSSATLWKYEKKWTIVIKATESYILWWSTVVVIALDTCIQ